MAGVRKGKPAFDRPLTGQRRVLVEEYYASLRWDNEADASKFLKTVSYALAQSYLQEPEKTFLKQILDRDGFTVDGIDIFRRSNPPRTTDVQVSQNALAELRKELLGLERLEPKQRGFEFERFLNHLFERFGLAPKGSFRLVGEQIDGSFELDSHVYLVEAKWHALQMDQRQLLAFRGQVESKSAWTRGLFVSNSGFTKDGLEAFAHGRATNIIGMSGQDLYFVLEGRISLREVIRRKARYAAERGEFYVSVFDLLNE
jgi:hypothetical protein